MTRPITKTPWPKRLEQNLRMVELFLGGETIAEIARQLRIARITVARTLREAGVPAMTRIRRGRPARPFVARDAAVARAHAKGEALAAIGRRHGLSRERVRQLCEREASSCCPTCNRPITTTGETA